MKQNDLDSSAVLKLTLMRSIMLPLQTITLMTNIHSFQFLEILRTTLILAVIKGEENIVDINQLKKLQKMGCFKQQRW